MSFNLIKHENYLYQMKQYIYLDKTDIILIKCNF